MKKTIMTAAAISAVLILTQMTACSVTPNGGSDQKLHIVCTMFAEYDWTKQLLGERAADADIKYLLENGSDLHSYQPTALDIADISSCDLLIYVGGESDRWAGEAAESAANQNIRVISLLDVIGDDVKTEELKEGMEAEEEHEADPGHDHTHDDSEKEIDEHVWLSVRNAKKICSAIADQLCFLDSQNQQLYRDNLSAYTEKLDKLDNEIRDMIARAAQKTLIIGDRFPFRYFTDDYGLDYYAAFPGCSAETEASFQTIVFLAEKMNECGAGTVFTMENSDGKIAQTIIENTAEKNQSISVLNSLQSVTAEQITAGATYISMMEENCRVLKTALYS